MTDPIERALRYIGENPEGDLSVEALSQVAGLSKFHFHRQFRAVVGTTVGRVVSLLRLKQASMALAFETDQAIIEIAYAAGFSNPESFARAFRRTQGQSPSEFRRAPRWERWADAFRDAPTTQPMNHTVEIRHFPETRVAVLEHLGPPERLMATVGRFIAWRKSCRDSPFASAMTFGVPWNDPREVGADAFRWDVCGSLSGPLSPNVHGVIEKVIPAGPCAVTMHRGSTDALGATVDALYRDWLPSSGETLRDFPVFFRYVAMMPEVSEHEQQTEVHLPLARC